MPRPKMRVTFEGAAELRDRLKDPALLNQPMVDLLTAASEVGRKTAVLAVDGGTGKAARSMTARVEPTQARVFSAMDKVRSRSIDQGRKPGAHIRELLPGLIRWREAVGHPDAAIVIARGIRRRGVKGRFFKRAAVDAVNNAMPDLQQALLRKLEGQWKKGAR